MPSRKPLSGFFGAAAKPAVGERLYGMAEATRQIKVAQRLHAVAKPGQAWGQLSQSERRPYIDQACIAPYDEQH